jgi:hypothetical protein
MNYILRITPPAGTFFVADDVEAMEWDAGFSGLACLVEDEGDDDEISALTIHGFTDLDAVRVASERYRNGGQTETFALYPVHPEPLAPWQIDFRDAYGEADYSHMETMGETHDAGDTIFTAVMLELSAREDCRDAQTAVDRLNTIISELEKARDAIRVDAAEG